MHLGARWLLVLVLVATGCAAADTSCPAPDVGTPPGWVGYVAAHRQDVSLAVDDGRGHRVSHRADRPQPLASTAKVVVLAAYGRAVASGVLRADEAVQVGEWERWLVPGTDGGAHVRALELAGIPHDGTRAKEPDRTVTVDRLANLMIQVSDNAAADFLRDRLGDGALRDAAADGGWPQPDLAAITGSTVALYAPELAPPLGAPRAERAAAEWRLARRYASEPAMRADIARRPLPPKDFERRWADRGAAAPAAHVAALHRAIATGSFGPGADVARRILEQGPSMLPGVVGSAYKGGSLAGVLTGGASLRRDDGTVASAALLVRRMPEPAQARASAVFRDVLVAMVNDPAVTERLRCLS